MWNGFRIRCVGTQKPILKSVKRFSGQDAWILKNPSRKVWNGFRPRCVGTQKPILKSVKRFSDKMRGHSKTHPEKCETVFGIRCVDTQKPILKSVEPFLGKEEKVIFPYPTSMWILSHRIAGCSKEKCEAVFKKLLGNRTRLKNCPIQAFKNSSLPKIS